MRCQRRQQNARGGCAASILAVATGLAVLQPGIATSLLRSSALPQAGELVHHVKEELTESHGVLGQVSAELLSVQSSVDHTEQSMLGRVLDLQTAQTLQQRHEEVDAANSHMELDISALNEKVEELSATLSRMQRAFVDKSHLHQDSQRRFHSEIVANEVEIQSMNAELAKEHDVQEELEKLAKIHQDLVSEATEVHMAGEKSEAMLATVRSASRSEVSRHKALRAQLEAMNSYSVTCHSNVEKASKTLGHSMLAESKDNQAAAMTLTQKKKASDASEQRLLAEHALLANEVQKVEIEALHNMTRVKDLRGDLHTLGTRIVSEVRSTDTKVDSVQERVKGLRTALVENSQAEMEDMSKKKTIEAQISDLIKQVHDNENPIVIATTEAQNDALQMELHGAYVLWKTAKTAETAALLDVSQVVAEVAAGNQTLKLVAQALATARDEGQLRVEEAVKKAAVSKEQSRSLLQKAQSAIAERCKADWDAIWKTKRTTLMRCKGLAEELAVEKAKKDTLMVTLKAQAEV